MRRLTFVIIAILLGADLAGAQSGDEGIRVGVTLSGGGARGFAHIGALKVFEEVGLPIDVVTGTSMGAVIGGFYAAGYTAHEIEEIALSGDWLAMIIARKSRSEMNFVEKRWDDSYVVSFLLEGYKVRLPSGLRSGQLLYDFLARKTMHVHDVDDFRELPIPFACVALNIETGAAVVLDHGDLPTAMRASMSFQSVFTPVDTEDGLLVDGGLVRNMPAADAFDLGADVVVGVDVSDQLYEREELESLVSILHQTVLISMNSNTKAQRGLCRLVIDPPLGRMSIADFDKVQFAIDAGEAAARESIFALRALADSVRATRPVVARADRPVEGPVAIATIDIEGLHRVPEEVVYRELRLNPPGEIAPDALQRGIARLMGTDYFEFIRWHIGGQDGKASLAVNLVEKSENRFRGGLRFDTDQKAHVLLNLTFRNVLLSSSLLQFDALFGEEPGGAATYFLHSRLLSAFGVKLQAAVRRPRFNVFQDDQKVAQYKAWYAWGETYFGSLYSTWLNAGVGGRLERVDMTTEIGGAAFPDSTDQIVPVFATVRIDTQDETIYPTTGLFVDIDAAFASDNAGSDNSFIRAYADWRLTLPVAEHVTILQELYLGRSWQDTPVAYQFSVGGVNRPRTFRGRQTSFLGVPADASIGPNAQLLMLGVQWEIIRNIIVQARWNAGNAFDSWSWNLKDNRYINGGGIVIGARLLNARAEISFATSELDDFNTHITVGNDL